MTQTERKPVVSPPIGASLAYDRWALHYPGPAPVAPLTCPAPSNPEPVTSLVFLPAGEAPPTGLPTYRAWSTLPPLRTQHQGDKPRADHEPRTGWFPVRVDPQGCCWRPGRFLPWVRADVVPRPKPEPVQTYPLGALR